MAHSLGEMAHSRRLIAAPPLKFDDGDIFPLDVRLDVQVRRVFVDRMQTPLRSLPELGGALPGWVIARKRQLRALAEEGLPTLDSKYKPRTSVEY